MRNYGEELKTQRILSNLSQTKLAKKTGIKQANISRWKSNIVIPSIEH